MRRDPVAPWIWRNVLNPFRQWLEDRHVAEASYVPQIRQWWRMRDELEHRTRRQGASGAFMVGRSPRAAVGSARSRPVMSALSFWALGGRALSRLLGARQRSPVGPKKVIYLNLLVMREKKRRRVA